MDDELNTGDESLLASATGELKRDTRKNQDSG
jgi:hypothetical protein